MTKKTAIAVAVVVLAAALALGYLGMRGPATKTVASLVVGTENDLTSLDPIKSQEPFSLRVIGQIFEGLVTLDGSNRLVPVLAESWASNATFDVWTFQIRKGVSFHEDDSFGAARTREVTAQDVVDSFQRIVSKESYPAFVLADTLAGVKEFQEGTAARVAGLRATGPYTVEMRLVRPEPAFLHRITSPWFCVFPKEAVALGPDVFGRTKAVGTGPFRLVSRADNEVVVERNPRYWRPVAGNIEKLTFRVIKNEQIRLSELRNGSVDLMTVPPGLVPAVTAGGPGPGGSVPVKPAFSAVKVQAFPTFNTHFVGLNCERLDVHFRRAVSLAVNRRELLDAVAQGAGTVTAGTVPPGLLGYEPPYSADLYDPVAARLELEKSSFKPASRKLELLVHEKGGAELAGQLLQAQLGKIGIQVAITKLDFASVVGRMIKGDTEAFVLFIEYVFSAPEPILENIFASSKIPVPNFWRYRSTEVDGIFERLRSTADRAQANALAREAEKRIIDEAPAVFLYQLSNYVASRAEVEGVAVNGHSIPLLWEARIR